MEEGQRVNRGLQINPSVAMSTPVMRNVCPSTGKVKHRNRKAALEAKRKFNNVGLDAYKCRYCHRWHLGNSRDPFRVQKRIDQLLGKGKK